MVKGKLGPMLRLNGFHTVFPRMLGAAIVVQRISNRVF